MSTVNTSLNETSVQNTKNITVTIPIKQKYQSLIAPAIGTNGNNIKSVKQRIISGLDPKFSTFTSKVMIMLNTGI